MGFNESRQCLYTPFDPFIEFYPHICFQQDQDSMTSDGTAIADRLGQQNKPINN
jgi:hypothetical protein